MTALKNTTATTDDPEAGKTTGEEEDVAAVDDPLTCPSRCGRQSVITICAWILVVQLIMQFIGVRVRRAGTRCPLAFKICVNVALLLGLLVLIVWPFDVAKQTQKVDYPASLVAIAVTGSIAHIWKYLFVGFVFRDSAASVFSSLVTGPAFFLLAGVLEVVSHFIGCGLLRAFRFDVPLFWLFNNMIGTHVSILIILPYVVFVAVRACGCCAAPVISSETRGGKLSVFRDEWTPMVWIGGAIDSMTCAPETAIMAMTVFALVNGFLTLAIVVVILWPPTIARIDPPIHSASFLSTMICLMLTGCVLHIVKYIAIGVVFGKRLARMYFGPVGVFFILFACGCELVTHLIGAGVMTLLGYDFPLLLVSNNLIGVIVVFTVGLFGYAPVLAWKIFKMVQHRGVHYHTFVDEVDECALYIPYQWLLLAWLIVWPPNGLYNGLWWLWGWVSLCEVVVLPLITASFVQLPFSMKSTDIFLMPFEDMIQLLWHPNIVLTLCIDYIILFVTHPIGYAVIRASGDTNCGGYCVDDDSVFSAANHLTGLAVVLGGIVVIVGVGGLCFGLYKLPIAVHKCARAVYNTSP